MWFFYLPRKKSVGIYFSRTSPVKAKILLCAKTSVIYREIAYTDIGRGIVRLVSCETTKTAADTAKLYGTCSCFIKKTGSTNISTLYIYHVKMYTHVRQKFISYSFSIITSTVLSKSWEYCYELLCCSDVRGSVNAPPREAALQFMYVCVIDGVIVCLRACLLHTVCERRHMLSVAKRAYLALPGEITASSQW